MNSPFLIGEPVRYRDLTLPGSRSRCGTVTASRVSESTGTRIVTVRLATSTLDTLPENLRLIRKNTNH